MDIREFRDKYPQYKGMSDIDLADRLYKRHYSDKDRGEFFKRFGVSGGFGVTGEWTPETVKERVIRKTGEITQKVGEIAEKGIDVLATPPFEIKEPAEKVISKQWALNFAKGLGNLSVMPITPIARAYKDIVIEPLKEEEPEEVLKESALATGRTVRGFGEFFVEPFGYQGYREWAESGFEGTPKIWEAMKERWLTDPVFSALGVAGIAGMPPLLRRAGRTGKHPAAVVNELKAEIITEAKEMGKPVPEIAQQKLLTYEGKAVGEGFTMQDWFPDRTVEPIPKVIRERKQPTFDVERDTLGTWVHLQGGIKKSDYMRGEKQHIREFGKGKFLIREKGIEVDRLAEMAKDEGFLPPDAGATEFITLLKDDLSGRKVHSVFKQDYFPDMPNIYDEGGAVRLVKPIEALKSSYKWSKGWAKVYSQKLADVFDVEAPFKRTGTPETGFHVKNYFSQRALHEEYGLVYGSELAKMVKHSKKDLGKIVTFYENPLEFQKLSPVEYARLKPAVDMFGKYFKDAQKEYAEFGVKVDFKSRIIQDMKDMIDRTTDMGEIAALKESIKNAEQMNFVHIPSAMWFEGLLSKDPSMGSRVLKLLVTQRRKNVRIQDLIDRRIIKAEDVSAVDILASYARRKGRDFATLKMIRAAKGDALASKYNQEGFVPVPYTVPILKGWQVHPAFAELLVDITKFSEGMRTVEKAFSAVKMMQFYNPFFLPVYDIVQGAMLGTFRTLKAPKHVRKGILDVWRKSPDYWEALDNGLASKPFNNPFASYKRTIEMVKRSKKGDVLYEMKKLHLPHEIIRSAYNLSWNTAWALDKTIRMMSYNYLRDKGYTPRDSAQIAAKFHSDYASVPAKTRRALNKVFFTPTFKITMGKLWGRMIADGIKATVKLGKVDKTTKLYGKGLIATFGIMEGFDLFMLSQGFVRDQWGRRYKKIIETEEGERELVLTWSTPANMFLKYIFRAKQALAPGVENPILSFFEMNIWEVHPVHRIAYQIASNKGSDNEDIYNRFDKSILDGEAPVREIKQLRYALKNIVRITGFMDKTKHDKKAIEETQKEMGQVLEMVTRPFVFKYLRSPVQRRVGYKVNKLRADFERLLRKGEVEPQHYDKFIKETEQILEELGE